jgi:hypothetical protein
MTQCHPILEGTWSYPDADPPQEVCNYAGLRNTRTYNVYNGRSAGVILNEVTSVRQEDTDEEIPLAIDETV